MLPGKLGARSYGVFVRGTVVDETNANLCINALI